MPNGTYSLCRAKDQPRDALKLLEAIELAKRDWRDVLWWAGFANSLTAHIEWAVKLLDKA